MRQLTLTAVAVWLGAMGFFAFIAAPAAFTTLDREAAGRFVSAVFPRYYAVGLALGLVALFGLGVRWMAGGWRGLDWLSAGGVLLMLALTLYAGAVVLPAAHAAREPEARSAQTQHPLLYICANSEHFVRRPIRLRRRRHQPQKELRDFQKS